MPGRESSGRPQSRALRAVDIVILAADAVVVAFLLFLLGTVALAGTDSWLYLMTGGRVFALMMAPGVTRIEFVIYAVVAVAIIGPIWHGSMRPSKKVDDSEIPRLDADGMRFDYVSQEEPIYRDSPDSTHFSANGGRRQDSSNAQSDELGMDWTDSVFDDTAPMASRSTEGFTRSPLDGSPSTAQPEKDTRSEPEKDDSTPDSLEGGDGAIPRSDKREMPPMNSGSPTADACDRWDDRSKGFAGTKDTADSTERIRRVISSSQDRIRTIERRCESVTDGGPIESVQRRMARDVRDHHRFDALENIVSGASPSPADAVAEIRAQEHRIESAIPVEFGGSRVDS